MRPSITSFTKNFPKKILPKSLSSGYFTASCIDRRLTNNVIEQVAKNSFDEITDPEQYSHRTVGALNLVDDTSTANLVATIKEKVKLQGRENFLMMIHDDCFGIRSGVVKTDPKEDYMEHLKKQIKEMAKNIDFFSMVTGGTIDFVASFYSHQKEGPDKVQTFKVKFDDKKDVELISHKKFDVDSKSKTGGMAR